MRLNGKDESVNFEKVSETYLLEEQYEIDNGH